MQIMGADKTAVTAVGAEVQPAVTVMVSATPVPGEKQVKPDLALSMTYVVVNVGVTVTLAVPPPPIIADALPEPHE